MTEKNIRFTSLWIPVIINMVVCLFFAQHAGAATGVRAGHVDMVLFGQSLEGDKTSLDKEHLTMEIGKMTAGGMAYGKNINDYVNLGFDFFIGAFDTHGSIGSRRDKGNATCFAINLNSEINLMAYPLTPFVAGGIGIIRFDGTWEEGMPFSEQDFSYHAGAGIRWDISQRLVIKGSYYVLWTNLQDTDSAVELPGYQVSLGMRL